MLRQLRRVAIDVTPVRRSRDFRLLALGQIASNLGTQAALVALPYQIFVISRSPTLVGLLGAFELGPMIVVSLVVGAILDRRDRRPILAVAQIAVIAVTVALSLVTFIGGRPPVLVVLLLGGILAGGTALNNVTASSMVPNILGAEYLRPGLAFNYGMSQATAIVGPGVGGLLIGLTGVGGVYVLDAVSCLGMLAAALAIAPQPPAALNAGETVSVRESIAEGLRFVRSSSALAGSLVIDVNAMLFGMPRALFAVLSLTVYHAGASGTGLLYAAISAGGTVSVFTSGWVQRARRLGRIVIAAVFFWGLAIVGAGLVRSIWPAVAMLAAAGWADGISAVCRSTISQTITPDRLRGRMSAFFSLVVTSGPRLGDMESGFVAGLAGALNSVLIGGIGCIAGVGACLLAFPGLQRYDAEQAMAELDLGERALHGAEEATIDRSTA